MSTQPKLSNSLAHENGCGGAVTSRFSFHRGGCPCCQDPVPVPQGKPQRKASVRPVLAWRLRQAAREQAGNAVQNDVD